MRLFPNTGKENEKLRLSRALNTVGVGAASPHGKTLFDFQKVLIPYSALAPNVLLADPPGVGKTVQEIAYLNYAKIKKALIIAPASLLFNWKKELKEWSTGFERVEIYSPKTFNPSNPPDVLLLSYAYLSDADSIKALKRWGKWEHLTLDECQYLKNPSSNRTKFLFAKNGLAKTGTPIHALSGTPLVNKPIELWPIIKNLCPESIAHISKFEYGLEFCNGKKLPWGWDFNGASQLPLLGQCLRSHFMVRRLKKDVLPQLPERYTPRLVYAKANQPAKDALSRIESLGIDVLKARAASPEFHEVSKARLELGLSKVPFAVSYISELIASGHDKLIVFAHHKEVIRELELGLDTHKIPHSTFAGGLSAKEKDKRVSEFQDKNKKIKIFIVSITAGGVGITLTASDYVVFVEYSWVPSENEQAIDRTHRIGQTRGVLTDYIVFEGSLDERILKNSFKKQNVIDEILK